MVIKEKFVAVPSPTNYSFWKTFKKFGIVFTEVLITGLIVYLTKEKMFLVLIPLLEAFRNWFKHRKK